MRRAKATIPEELDGVLKAYRHDLEFSPSLAALMQAALGEYLQQRGYVDRGGRTQSRLVMYEDAPPDRGEKTAAEMVVEDRR